ncbi:T9SS type A sorting domain-containing protein [uncultured Draconibacterium sp.]|uniref:T9SS type A sorting domain-containing protein n=1 Tax=uncultured Draconibacterium sp. TaxID=1573823 RepID=UPI0025DF7EE5|nr:T9SS type A sorting domain-containing protein [uncultured Draconibacterium sp.]
MKIELQHTRIIITFFLCIISINILAQKSSIFLLNNSIEIKSLQIDKQGLDSIIEITVQYQNEDRLKTEFLYDSNEKDTARIRYTWDDATNEWHRNLMAQITYDSIGRISMTESYLWRTVSDHIFGNRTDWHELCKIEYKYDKSGNEDSQIEYAWLSNGWGFFQKYDFTYDSTGNKTSMMHYWWDNQNDKWIGLDKSIIEYDSIGNSTFNIHYFWDEQNKKWIYDMQNKFTYDSFQNVILNEQYGWDASLDKWNFQNKSEYSYDSGGNIILEAISYWSNSTNNWAGYSKVEHKYDSNSNEVLKKAYGKSDATSTWHLYEEYEWWYNLSYEYNELILPHELKIDSRLFNNQLVQKIHKDYNSDITYQTSYFYSNHTVTGTTSDLPINQIHIFPNPASNSLNINNFSSGERAVFYLFDINGKVVLVQNLYDCNQVSTESLRNGIYCYKLVLAGTVQNGKVVIQH